MKTIIIEIDGKKPEPYKIKYAADIIKNGGIVAFPTETVYGLGAIALDEKAVRKIFEAKERPTDNPLIVHIANLEDVKKLAKDIPDNFYLLAEKFWPGPLSLILKKKDIVPDIVTAGLDSVALRMPNNKVALELIKEAGPIAAPSANISTKPSSTSIEHVIKDFDGKIDCIIKSDSSEVGLESTTIDLTSKPARLLRPGGVTFEELREVVDIEVFNGEEKNASPGMKYKHYSPDAKVVLVEGDRIEDKINSLIDSYKGKKTAVITTNKNHSYGCEKVEFIGDELETIAKNLFAVFRKLDEEAVEVIIIEGISEKGLGHAIMNRIRKASFEIIKN